MLDPQFLLGDEEMQQFIAEGYLTLKSSLPSSLHQDIYQRTEEVFAKEGNPGNNILPRIPALQQVFDDPVVRGALTSVVGPDYIMHAHRHCHINPAGGQGGGWHKDSYWGYRKVRYHRNRWVMIFYYPQDVALENGPTAVMPGTHYYNDRAADEKDERHLPVCGEAGTCTLVHFDLWHRAMPNSTEANRYMMKFQFTRISEPSRPTWNIQAPEWPANGSTPSTKHRVVWSRIWDWHAGTPSRAEASGQIEQLIESLQGTLEQRLAATDALGALGGKAAPALDALLGALGDEAEPVRLNAAYALGAVGAAAVDPLMAALDDEREHVREHAAYALGAVGEEAVDALVAALSDERAHVRGFAAYALGDMGPRAGAAAATALCELHDDPDTWVRRNVAEALGTIELHSEGAVPALAALLADEDEQVRFNAAYALAHFGPGAAAATEALAEALNDENRYVQGHSSAALQQIGTPEAQDVLLHHLTAARWCPITTKETTF